VTSTKILWLVYIWLPTGFVIDLMLHSALVWWKEGA
jgi:hypothetical protein